MEFTLPGLVSGWRKVKVSGVLSETFGSRCYLQLDRFPDVLQVDPLADILLISAEPGHFEEVKKELFDSGRVTWMVDKRKTRRTFSDMFGSMTIMVDVFNILSVIAGVILIYNISMINLRERTTELVTLRVLGTTDRELGWMLLFEMIIYFVSGILMGFPGNYLIRKLFESMMKTDSYTEDGTISLGESFKVISEVSGPVQEVRVTENQTVKKGTVLYRIGSDDYSYELDVLKAQLAGYEAQFEKAKVGNVMTLSPEEYLEDLRKQKESAEASLSAAASTYTAYTGLFAAGDVAKTDYEGIRAEYENAEAA